ncbi:hypothetical protein ABU162_16255 [Paenibacillus thiaminolyticus]|uniref:hypothetical protein n=1 Tax=Paenibacillus thiaminolyticus TaxID=49283 RepID=UPI0035A71193
MKGIPGILLLFLIALIAGCATADSERWQLSPVFDVKFTDDQGRERAFAFRGVEGKSGCRTLLSTWMFPKRLFGISGMIPPVSKARSPLSA